MSTSEHITEFEDTIEVRGLLDLATWKNDEPPHHIDLTIRTQLGEYQACITTPDEGEWVRYVHDPSGQLMSEEGVPVRGDIHEAVAWTLTLALEDTQGTLEHGGLRDAS